MHLMPFHGRPSIWRSLAAGAAILCTIPLAAVATASELNTNDQGVQILVVDTVGNALPDAEVTVHGPEGKRPSKVARNDDGTLTLYYATESATFTVTHPFLGQFQADADNVNQAGGTIVIVLSGQSQYTGQQELSFADSLLRPAGKHAGSGSGLAGDADLSGEPISIRVFGPGHALRDAAEIRAALGTPQEATGARNRTSNAGHEASESDFANPGANIGGTTCAAATIIAALPYTDAAQTTVGGGVAGAACAPAAVSSGPTRFYRLTATATGVITASLCGSGFDTAINIYSGACPGVCVVGNDDFCGLQSQASWGPTIGVQYTIAVNAFGGASGTYTLNVTQATTPPPANDVCTSAQTIAVPSVTNLDTTLATPDPTAPDCTGAGTGSNGLWYKVAGTGQRIRLNTCANSLDTVLDVYCGTCATLACGAFNDDTAGCGPIGFGSQVDFNSAVGVDYLVLVRGWLGGSGPTTLTASSLGANVGTVLCTPCITVGGQIPENEPCGSNPPNGNNGGCNSVPPVWGPTIACGQEILGTAWFNTVTPGFRDTDWFPFTVPPGPNLRVRFTHTAEFLHQPLQVWGGAVYGGPVLTSCPACISQGVFANSCDTVQFTECLPPGQYTTFQTPQFAGNLGCASGNRYTIHMDCLGPCGVANDICTAATPLTVPGGGNASINGSTLDANPDVIASACGTATTGGCQGTFSNGGVWYTVQGTGNLMTATTCPPGSANFNSQISIYCKDCAEPKCVAGNDTGAGAPACGTNARVSWCTQIGATYRIYVQGNGLNIRGNFTLNVSDNGQACTNPVQCLPTGACCMGSTNCIITDQIACLSAGRRYLGNNVGCIANEKDYQLSPNTPILDPPAPAGSSTLTVPDSFLINDLDVDLKITHTWVGDISVWLVHGATTVTLQNRPVNGGGGCTTDNYDINLNDQGTGGNIQGQCVDNLTSPPDYVPFQPLSAFNNQQANGAWTLFTQDFVGGDVGIVNRWSLHFIPQPGPVPACNRPPICNAGGPYTKDCQGATTTIQLDGSGSSDPDGDAITFAWTSNCPGAVFDSATAMSPKLTINSSGCSQTCQVNLTVRDAFLGTSCSAAITVQDVTPPVFDNQPSLGCGCAFMWPPNHKYVDFHVMNTNARAHDDCSGTGGVSFRFVNLRSSQPEDGNGNGDGSTTRDAVISADGQRISLRSERDGGCAPLDRTYTVQLEATDACGNSSLSNDFSVCVFHDQGGQGPGTLGIVFSALDSDERPAPVWVNIPAANYGTGCGAGCARSCDPNQ